MMELGRRLLNSRCMFSIYIIFFQMLTRKKRGRGAEVLDAGENGSPAVIARILVNLACELAKCMR